MTKNDIIHKALSEVLCLLRDNPKDETNPQMFSQVLEIMSGARVMVNACKEDPKCDHGYPIGYCAISGECMT